MTTNTTPPSSLTRFQAELSAYLRCSNMGSKLPENIPPKALGIYKDLVFGNLTRFIDKCFPVAKSIVPTEQWQNLCENFFAQYTCSSPFFNDIPKHFCDYTRQLPTDPLRPWFADLLHYEWLELAADTHPADVPPATPWLPKQQLAVNPTLFNVAYAWPVHLIGPQHCDVAAHKTHLLVFRHHSHDVKFIEVNALTAELIHLLSRNPTITAIQLLDKLHQSQPQLELKVLYQFGTGLVDDLVGQNVILIG